MHKSELERARACTHTHTSEWNDDDDSTPMMMMMAATAAAMIMMCMTPRFKFNSSLKEHPRIIFNTLCVVRRATSRLTTMQIVYILWICSAMMYVECCSCSATNINVTVTVSVTTSTAIAYYVWRLDVDDFICCLNLNSSFFFRIFVLSLRRVFLQFKIS